MVKIGLHLLETTLIFYPKLGTYLKQVSKSLSLHGCCPHSKYVEKTNQFCMQCHNSPRLYEHFMRYTALVKVEFLIVFDFPDQTMTGSLSRHLQKVAILGLPYAHHTH